MKILLGVLVSLIMLITLFIVSVVLDKKGTSKAKIAAIVACYLAVNVGISMASMSLL